MKQEHISFGFKPEFLSRVQPSAGKALSRLLLRGLVVLLGLAAVFTALAMTTDIEELLLPRTVILRGNRLSPASEVLLAAGLPRNLDMRSLLPASSKVSQDSNRWIRSLETRMLPGRRMLLSVDERMPLLPMDIGGHAYWICSDGEVVRRDRELDVEGRFEELNRLPVVQMAGSGIDAEYEVAEMLILTAGICRDALDRRITGIEVQANGEFILRTDRGITVQLGIPADEDEVRRRLSALPKAIRISDKYDDATSIDLRNGKVAYLRTSGDE